MPEGDTIYRLARQLSVEWVGQRLERLWLRDRGEVKALRDARIREVSALGKHLLMAFVAERNGREQEWILHTHLGMPGRWHRPGTGAAWRERETPAAEVTLRGTKSWRCTHPARCELFSRAALRDHPDLRRLGPDLLMPPVPFAVVTRRARSSRGVPLAELLLDQRVACGLGNVYKNELLFLGEYAPRTPVANLDDGELEALYRRGAELLAANLGPARRRTRGLGDPRSAGPRFWVYDRGGRPCLRCATPIRVERLGDAARVTYWCPNCQPLRPLRPARSAADRRDGCRLGER